MSTKNKIIYFTISLILFVVISQFCIINSAIANPMLKNNTNVENNQVAIPGNLKTNEPSFFRVGLSKVLIKSMETQRKFGKSINEKIQDIKTNKNYGIVFLVMLFGFLYGIIHAIGPGHGKVVISSYFLAKKARIKDGILVGLYTAFTHGISAIIFVSILNLTLRTFLSEQKEIYYIKLISYTLITIIGIYLLVRTVLEQMGKAQKHSHEHLHDIDKISENNLSKAKNKELYILSIIIGMIPCAGSMLILLYTLSQEVYWLGVLTVLSISLGISLTLIMFGLLAILMRNAMLKNKLSAHPVYLKCFEYSARYLGAICITLLGSFLFAGVL